MSILIDSSTPITTGTTYQLNAATPQKVISYSEFRGTSNTAFVWNYAKTGSITVQSIDSSTVTLVLSGVGFSAQSGGAAGSFTFNGTFTVPRR
ncbi:hypothetical protein EON83_17315 [bacterium]|nr:MAG: hypothetical protein EON83_17315 [bacterium]